MVMFRAPMAEVVAVAQVIAHVIHNLEVVMARRSCRVQARAQIKLCGTERAPVMICAQVVDVESHRQAAGTDAWGMFFATIESFPAWKSKFGRPTPSTRWSPLWAWRLTIT